MVSTERQLQIRRRLAALDLTPCARLASIPADALTVWIIRLNRHRASGKPIPEEIAHVVPHLVGIIEVVCEDSLADVGFENAALSVRELEGNAAGNGVATEGFAVGSVSYDSLLRTNGAADGPEVYGFVALIGYDSTADGWRSSGGKSARDKGDECESVAEHVEPCEYFRCVDLNRVASLKNSCRQHHLFIPRSPSFSRQCDHRTYPRQPFDPLVQPPSSHNAECDRNACEETKFCGKYWWRCVDWLATFSPNDRRRVRTPITWSYISRCGDWYLEISWCCSLTMSIIRILGNSYSCLMVTKIWV
jgi:hypothetical protein